MGRTINGKKIAIRQGVLERLIYECEIAESRMRALCECEFAMESLQTDEGFGIAYKQLLKEDLRSLGNAILMGGRELEKCRQDRSASRIGVSAP